MRSLQPWAITMAYNSGEADRLLPFEEPGSTSRNSPQSQEFAVDLRTVHEVRIHLPPPDSLNCRETLLRCSLNWRETRAFRSDLLDHVIVLNERHLRWLLKDYVRYYHEDRTHLGLGKDTPGDRVAASVPPRGQKVTSLPRLGGLHHRYAVAA